VLICSGLTLESLQDDVLDLPANGFLQKPFAIGTLKQKIEGLLKSVQGETKGGPRRTPS
jgi:DNA-binding response OmpR family regulator